MVFQSPGDVIFSVFGFSVYYYGIIMAFACFIGVYLSIIIYKHFNPEKNYGAIWEFSPWLLIFGIIGARLYYCFLNPAYYISNPLEILDIRAGGLSIHGAVIAGLTALAVFAKRYKLGVLNLFDAFACGTVFAQAVGRWGNFFNSEAFGLPTDLPWKLYIPPHNRPEMFMNFEYFHPTFLYESILDLCIFGILLFAMKHFSNKYTGITFALYLILYSIARIIVEQIRIDSALNIGNIHIAQLISVIMLTIGIVSVFAIKYSQKSK